MKTLATDFIIRDSPFAIAILDQSPMVLDCSHIWKEQFGRAQLQLNEQNIKTLFPTAAKALFQDIQKGLNGSIINAPSRKYQRAEGHNQWLKWHIHPWSKDSGDLGGIFLILEDKTLEQREKELYLKAEMVSKTGSWSLDLLTNELFWSPMTKKIHEVPQDYIPDLETAINFYKPGPQREQLVQLVDQGINEGTPWEMELVIITATGKEVWIHGKGEAEMVNGKCVRIFGTFQDIDEKKRAALQNQEIAERLKIATKTANIGIWEYQLRDNKLLWDDNMLSLYGLKPNDFDNDFEAWEKVVHPEDRARCQMELEKTIKYKTDYQTEFRIVTPTGTVKQIKAIAKSFRDESGQTIKLIGANWDVTDMKNTQEKLAQSLFTFTEIFEKSAVGMALVSPAGKWLKVNKSLCQILGYPEEELLNLSIDDVTYQDDLEKSKKNIHNAVHDQLDNYQLDKCYVHKNGHLVHTIINVTVVRTEAGSVQHFIGQVLDITSKINAEQRLNELLQVSKAQNKSLLNFAHIVSHNLRSHTSNLSMLSKFMMEEEDLEEQAKLNQMFLNATERLSETIYHLNEVVRVKTMVKDKLTKIDLNTIIKNTENSLKGILLENNVKISVKVPEGTSVMGIPAYMESILLNLYTNAIKYAMPQRRPFIEIWSKEKKGLVHIFVKDNGLGIDLKRHGEHIFGMYKTFHKHKDAKGIGLFITKNQVEAMTGTITVQSAVHQGTTFKIKLKNGRSYAGED